MLYANRISKEVNKRHLEKIISALKWLNFENVSAYYVEAGVIQSCLDEDFEAINNEIIDGASDEINTDYEKMVELRCDSRMEVK